jgi:type II secretory pathway component PulC
MSKIFLIGLTAALAGWGFNEAVIWQLERLSPPAESAPISPRPSTTPEPPWPTYPPPKSAPSVAEAVLEPVKPTQPVVESAPANPEPKQPRRQAQKTSRQRLKPAPAAKSKTPKVPVFKLDRQSLKAQFRSPADLAGHGHILPHYRDGERHGMRFGSVAPGGIFARLGMQSGDVVLSVNGRKLTTQHKALADFEAMRKMTTFLVLFERGGQTLRHKYIVE